MIHIEKKIQDYVISQLRRLFRYSDQYRITKKRTELAPNLHRCEGTCQKIINKDGKYKGSLKFDEVGKMYVDHIDPVVPVEGFQNDAVWAMTIILRVFPGAEFLQYLCKECHQAKTNIENAERRRIKKERIKNA